MDAMFDESLLQEFVTEGREHLANIEPDLLTLEAQGAATDQEIINRIFRAIHSIKGASGFFGFEAVKSLSHVMENVLMLIRDGKLVPSPELIEPLLKGVDKLTLMMDDIQASDAVAYQDEVAQLEAMISGKPTEAKPAEAAPASASAETKANSDVLPEPLQDPAAEEGLNEVAAEPASATPAATTSDEKQFKQVNSIVLQQSIVSGQRIYKINLDVDADCRAKNVDPADLLDTLKSVGLILDANLDGQPLALPVSELEKALQNAQKAILLYGSVLEVDLLSVTFNLAEAAFETIANPMETLLDTTPAPKAPAIVLPETTTAPQETPKTAPAKTNEDQSNTEEQAVEQKPVTAASAPGPKPEPEKAESKAPAKKSMASDASNETVRVRIDLLNKLMDLAGEMVLGRNQLLRTLSQEKIAIPGLTNIVQNLDLITTHLQEHIMQTRMQPIGNVFSKFPRIVRDMAKMLGKNITLEMSGEEVALDKTIIECLSDPLTHLIRNCCDHALEGPEERTLNGKSPQGTIWLKAYHQDGQIHIAIIDDGRGINADKIANKALDKGLITESDIKRMSVQEKVNLIMLPGFSTAETVSEISGRGVGMDVVRTNIEKMGGHINIETEVGKGTTLLLKLPLTLAIIPSLIVGVSDQRFAIPQINLVELVRVKAADVAEKIERVGNANVLRLRGQLLPLLRLADVLRITKMVESPTTGELIEDRRRELADSRELHTATLNHGGKIRFERRKHDAEADAKTQTPKNRRQDPASDYNILVLKVGVNQFGLIIDELFDPEEIVVKPLSGYLKECKCFAGSAIMGDGRVAMILDAGGIVATTGISFEEINAQHQQEALMQQARMAAQGDRRSILLFNNAANEVFAFPLSSVMRLEKIDLRDIKRMGDGEFITYYGKGLPILRLENYLPVQPFEHAQSVQGQAIYDGYLILPNEGHGEVGILTSKILDATETTVMLDTSLNRHAGIEGTAIVNNALTLFVDPEGLLTRAGVLKQAPQLVGV
ncbi:MAG: chemotaxis protein CheW [Vampirovibrionales bacterium]|nr:chemotaxis protein CheW [Vampirovibrionales bacterium]